MHDVGVRRDRPGLVRLQLTHEVPPQIKINARLCLRRGLLVAVLADVGDAELSEHPDVIGRERLRDDDQRDLLRIATGLVARGRDPATDRLQIRGDRSPPVSTLHGSILP